MAIRIYRLIDQSVFEDMPKQDANLVVDILNLYQIIEHVKTMTRDKRPIKDYYGSFRGFDGNHETDCDISSPVFNREAKEIPGAGNVPY